MNYQVLVIILIIISFIQTQVQAQTNTDTVSVISKIPVANRIAMVNFDDAWAPQYTLAKPILDQFGIKATFFTPCFHISEKPRYMTWPHVMALKTDGMDIESHTMTHAHLLFYINDDARLNYEIEGSRVCLAQHGISSKVFGYPLNQGTNNTKIIDLVAHSFPFARAGDEPLFILNCNYPGHPVQQKNCAPVQDGNLTYSNRYNIKAKSFYHIIHGGSINYNEDQMFERFQSRLASEAKYNMVTPTAIPIFVYHNVTTDMNQYNQEASTITAHELEREMQFLHDNNFRVILLSKMIYDYTLNTFFVPPT